MEKIFKFIILALFGVGFMGIIAAQSNSLVAIGIDSGRVFIGDHQLSLATDTSTARQNFGPPSRVLWEPNHTVGALIWDSLGVTIGFRKFGETTRPTVALFYFRNLSSKEGRKGKIGDLVSERYIPRYTKRRQKKDLVHHGDAYVEKLIRFSNDSIFPYTFSLLKAIMIDGETLTPQTQIATLNDSRENKGYQTFQYYSRDHHIIGEYVEVQGQNKSGFYILTNGMFSDSGFYAIKLFYSELDNLYYMIFEFPVEF